MSDMFSGFHMGESQRKGFFHVAKDNLLDQVSKHPLGFALGTMAIGIGGMYLLQTCTPTEHVLLYKLMHMLGIRDALPVVNHVAGWDVSPSDGLWSMHPDIPKGGHIAGWDVSPSDGLYPMKPIFPR